MTKFHGIPPGNGNGAIVAVLTPIADRLSPRQQKVFDGLQWNRSIHDIAGDLHWKDEEVRLLRLILECYAYRVAYGPLPAPLNLDTLFTDFTMPLPRHLTRHVART